MLGDLTIKEFISRLASQKSVPGGGSVAALASALASSLVAMVSQLTLDKPGYEDIQEELNAMIDEMNLRKCEFIQLIDKDSNAFSALMEAYELPKNMDTEIRLEAIQDALKFAAKVPLRIAIDTSKLFKYIEIVVIEGNQRVVSDGIIAAMMARTAIRSALYNVRINLELIHDKAYVSELEEQIKELNNFAKKREEEILSKASLKL